MRRACTDFDREIDRARRLDGVLAVAYVDVVGLKAVNDAHGHSAGDALLRRAVQVIRAHLRSYDLTVRLGGDEFLCAMSGATIEDARQRFDGIQAALAAEPEPAELNVGFAALSREDGAAELIERADPKLPRSRPRILGPRGRPGSGPRRPSGDSVVPARISRGTFSLRSEAAP